MSPGDLLFVFPGIVLLAILLWGTERTMLGVALAIVLIPLIFASASIVTRHALVFHMTAWLCIGFAALCAVRDSSRVLMLGFLALGFQFGLAAVCGDLAGMFAFVSGSPGLHQMQDRVCEILASGGILVVCGLSIAVFASGNTTQPANRRILRLAWLSIAIAMLEFAMLPLFVWKQLPYFARALHEMY